VGRIVLKEMVFRLDLKEMVFALDLIFLIENGEI
jgi:hypothetical protein